jgi:hypothetical protein
MRLLRLTKNVLVYLEVLSLFWLARVYNVTHSFPIQSSLLFELVGQKMTYIDNFERT